MYYSGNKEANYINGDAVPKRAEIICDQFHSFIRQYHVITTQTSNLKFNSIQVYTPTAVKYNEGVELFYEHINSVLSSVKSNDAILDDFSAKIEKWKCYKYVGEYRFEIRNGIANKLLQFCLHNDEHFLQNFNGKTVYFNISARQQRETSQESDRFLFSKWKTGIA